MSKPGVNIPGTPICIDSFERRFLQKYASSFNFLVLLCSHAHSDHTGGLEPSWQNESKIHCSRITRNLLIHNHGMKADAFRVLEAGQTHQIFLNRSKTESMTCRIIKADNHCPGAVMFYLEGYFGRVLYTGDIRNARHRNTSEWKHVLSRSLRLSPGPIDVAYIDNSTINLNFAVYLSEVETCNVLLRLLEYVRPCDLWIESDNIGKEKLFVMLAHLLQTKIYVSQKRYQILQVLQHESLLLQQEIDDMKREPLEQVKNIDWTHWFDYFTDVETMLDEKKSSTPSITLVQRGTRESLLMKLRVENECRRASGRCPVIALIFSGLEGGEQYMNNRGGKTGTINIEGVLENTDGDVYDVIRTALMTQREASWHAGKSLENEHTAYSVFTPTDNVKKDITELLYDSMMFITRYSAHSSYGDMMALVQAANPRWLEGVNRYGDRSKTSSGLLHKSFNLVNPVPHKVIAPSTMVPVSQSSTSVATSSKASSFVMKVRTNPTRQPNRAMNPFRIKRKVATPSVPIATGNIHTPNVQQVPPQSFNASESSSSLQNATKRPKQN